MCRGKAKRADVEALCAMSDLEKAELIVNQHRSGGPGRKRGNELFSLIDSPFGWGPDRRRSGPHPEPFSSTGSENYGVPRWGPTSVLIYTLEPEALHGHP
jgi:hypothetical protein